MLGNLMRCRSEGGVRGMRSMRGARGMTLVELMVGLAIGLFIVGTAMGLALHQLRDDSVLLQESRLRINMQAAADMVVRDLRRAGYRRDAGSGIARDGAVASTNPFTAIDWLQADALLTLAFETDNSDRFAFRLQDGALKMAIGGKGAEEVTDSRSMTVTAFTLTPYVDDVPLDSFCEQPCPAADPACPHQQVRRYDLTIAARSATNAAVTGVLSTNVRVRNDLVVGACPA